MTGAELRESFLQFFEEKSHARVPSAPLLPTSPNLLFTNAGMNQFIPFFLGEEQAPYDPPRAADTQKCIRAGGKHNDLEDVGYDTYHHTFFEMLGNWSFGDYFKQEAIAWAWELVVERWGFPVDRLYATVYRPAEGDPGEFDAEAHALWSELFTKAGVDPAVHVVDGNKKDNFWMMGETGPCGPCSELHVDLTPEGDSKGSLVNADDARCIEIWNLVFIQYNAESDGSFSGLPSCHVDTGMGFERVASIVQGTRGFTDFSRLVSNYDSDIFGPLLAHLEEVSGCKYEGTVPSSPAEREGLSEQMQRDIAFRVLCDHARTISFAIADGIPPGNKDRNYVIRRILRRAVRYARVLGLASKAFLAKLCAVVIESYGKVFPELVQLKTRILETVAKEEAQFLEKLERGVQLFEKAVGALSGSKVFPAEEAFKLYDTYGFPVDLTALMAEEKGLSLDEAAVEALMEAQKEKAREARKASLVKALDVQPDVESAFVGFEQNTTTAKVMECHGDENSSLLVINQSVLYAEKGGQVGDRGTLTLGKESFEIQDATWLGSAIALQVELPIEEAKAKFAGQAEVEIQCASPRRSSIEAHHSATHLLHWALRKVLGYHVAQQGSLVDEGRLRFDFSSEAVSAEALQEVEALVNEAIWQNHSISWQEVEHASIKEREDIMQFFGDKYGEKVRVVQIGGEALALDGFSMELCGGTHARQTSQLGSFRILSEGAVAAGTRRIEAVCGLEGWKSAAAELRDLKSQVEELQGALKEAGKALDKEKAKQGKALLREAYQSWKSAEQASGEKHWIVKLDGPASMLNELPGLMKQEQHEGVAVCVLPEKGEGGEKVHLLVWSAKAAQEKYKAGELFQKLVGHVEGRGGGKAEMARGAGTSVAGVGALLEEARGLLG